MCCKRHCLALVLILICVLHLRSEWVEISVQKKPLYSTTENVQVLRSPESYSNISDVIVPATSSYFDFFVSPTTTANPKNEFSFSKTSRLPKETSRNNISEKQKKITTKKGEENMNGFLSILQDVQEDLLKNPHKHFQNKLDVLVNLKNKLFLQIQNRISDMWPIQPNTNKKYPRGYKDDSYLEFPSNEAAMLTIGFLTFAVFLIKLVLKIIHALKYKSQNYTYMPATMITTSGKKKRSIHDGLEDEEFLKIMESLHSFPNNYYTSN